jgi:hypothetical protein
MSDLKELWPIEPLSEATRKRLIAQATRAPQLTPWPRAIADAIERALSEWRYGLAYKLAGAMACVALGLGIGFNLEAHDHDVAGLAFMSSTTAASAEMPE